MCLYPTLIKNRKYTANKKNGGVIPPVKDERTLYVPIGCQDCLECRKQKTREWQVRLLEDLKAHRNGKFITLTFSNEAIAELIENPKNLKETSILKNLQGYELDNAIATCAVRLFLERWRKKYKKSLRHWLVTELGHNGTENIHLHGIVWTDTPLEELEKIWAYGFVWKGKKMPNGKLHNYVNGQTVNYIVKYVNKVDEDHKYYKSKILTSPGIGGNYMKRTDYLKNKFKGTETDECYKTPTGHKIAMPIYWRNKIYTEDERTQLWLQRLDKQERWICGERVDIRKGEQAYNKLLKWHQRRNTKLGYGNGEKNWDRMNYETQRRILMNAQRLENARKKENNNKKNAGAGYAGHC